MTTNKTQLNAAQFEKALAFLKDKDAQILKLRLGLAGETPHTLREVGKILNLSHERIRQLEKRAMRRLKHPATIKKLKEMFNGSKNALW
jgi:RNA polymerase primary sigma factor